MAWLVRRLMGDEERTSVKLHSVNQLINITVPSYHFNVKPHEEKVLYLTGKKPSSQQRKEDLYQRLPALLHSLQLIYSANLSNELRTEDAWWRNVCKQSIAWYPCSINATFARGRERSPQVLIIQESTEKKNPSVRYFPSARQNWTFVIICSRRPHNCKTGHFTLYKERERLQNVKRWKMHVQSVQKYCFSLSYANLCGFCCRRRRGCLSFLLIPKRFQAKKIGAQFFNN